MISQTRPIEELDKDLRKLVVLAKRARKRAYAPYSKYQVGCALVDAKGRLHSGCNVENASYSAAICAERVALSKMVSRGSRDAVKIVVLTSSEEPTFPCGICLQVIQELGRDAIVYAVNGTGTTFREATVKGLYPAIFSKKLLNQAPK